jgi:hypothetical protein
MDAFGTKPQSDIALYLSLRDSSETGCSISRGTDLFAHRATSGTIYFYHYHGSLYSNETNICQITSEESVRNYLLEHMKGEDRYNITDPGRILFLKYLHDSLASGNP